MAVNVDETISIHCHPINCHFWSLAFFFSFFMWNLACMTGDDYFISSDESVETIELFSKSLRVNKFPWWVTCIKYYLTIFLLCSTFLPLRQSKYVRLLSGCSCYTIPCSVQKVNISIARGIWFIRSSFFPLRVLIASNSKINGYESLVRILAWLFYVWHCQKILWQWNKHERNKYFAFASASAAIAITNTRRAISTFTLFTICCTFFSSLYFYVISIYSILFGWCIYKFFFGILEFLKPCEVWFTCVIYLWQ